ncbi:hypothetical protein D3C87_1940070 [compost metagenome]
MAFLAAKTERIGRQAKQRAVIQHVAMIIAPGGVVDAAGAELSDIADGQAVKVTLGVRSGDPVFDHRRNIE